MEAPPNRQGGPNLATAIALLPTPRTSDTNGSGAHGDGGMDLRTAVTLLPTPKANDSKATRTSQRAKDLYSAGPTLTDAVLLLPTPRASDGEKGGPNQRGSKGDLALPAVAHRIGAGSTLPSDAGSTSSDDEPLGQLTIAID